MTRRVPVHKYRYLGNFAIRTALPVMASFALLAVGCGGDATSPPPGNAKAAATGSVEVTVTGLPNGTDGAITIEGDLGFVQQITASGVVGGVPVGTCTVTALPVGTTPGDTLVVLIPVRTVPVVANDTTSVTLTYETPPPSGISIKAFHGPLVFQGARRSDTYVALADYGGPTTTKSEIDTYSLPYPSGYVLSGCDIAGTDVTAAGISITTSMSSQFGSGSADASLVVNSDTSVTVTASASGSGSASTAFVGNGATTGVLNLGYPGTNGLYDASIVISNPGATPFDLVISWSYNGSVANTAYAYWRQRFVYQIDPTVCSPNPMPIELFHGKDFAGPASDAGTVTIPLTGTRHIVGLGMQTEASGSWAMDHLGTGDSGSASCTGSVTFEIVR